MATNPFRVTEQDLNPLQKVGPKPQLNKTKAGTCKNEKKVWQRSTSDKSRSEWIKELLKENERDGNSIKNERQNKVPQKDDLRRIVNNIDKYISRKGDQDDKEGLNELISKKRDIFLLQMSLNVKRDEIRKLDENASAKEDALQRCESMLEEDAQRFDIFLKENDKKAQDAIRLAEKETKTRMEKVQEIKKLNQKLQLVQSSNNKHKSGLEECLRYKSFLEELTPSNWFQEQNEKKRIREREEERTVLDQTLAHEKSTSEIEVADANPEALPSEPSRVQISSPENESKDKYVPNCSAEEETPMYFDSPQQLPEIFSTLEEENLFLIQNAQEAEQSLDEMIERFEQSRDEIQKKSDAMQRQICIVKNSIATRQSNLDPMRVWKDGTRSNSHHNEQYLMANLTKNVKKVYEDCGFSFTGATPSTLFMLAEIESKMEGVICCIRSIPEQKFKTAYKAKEKKRREAKRSQQQVEQHKAQEERNRKAIERSMQPPKKLKGKKVRHQIHYYIDPFSSTCTQWMLTLCFVPGDVPFIPCPKEKYER